MGVFLPFMVRGFGNNSGGVMGTRNIIQAQGERGTCDSGLKRFRTRLSCQRAVARMLLNVAGCDFDFSNDFWPRAILLEAAGG